MCKSCTTCPFAFTDESEEVQSYGCLPTAWDILQMKRESGHNWSCHSNDKVQCQGMVNHVEWMQKEFNQLHDIDTSTGGLISYETWYQEGQEIAIQKAGENAL